MVTKIFLDGADAILENAQNPFIKGFTTNPSLMRKAGVEDYFSFAIKIAEQIKYKPVSFEVLSDDFNIMIRQAQMLSALGDNVYVKIPIMNTKGESSYELISYLISEKIKVNVTAICTLAQAINVLPLFNNADSGYISVFAGRIADCGYDYVDIMKKVAFMAREVPNVEIIWASTREIYNVIQAQLYEIDIITVGTDLFKKHKLLGTDLFDMSLNTVKMFYKDAKEAGYDF